MDKNKTQKPKRSQERSSNGTCSKCGARIRSKSHTCYASARNGGGANSIQFGRRQQQDVDADDIELVKEVQGDLLVFDGDYDYDDNANDDNNANDDVNGQKEMSQPKMDIINHQKHLQKIFDAKQFPVNVRRSNPQDVIDLHCFITNTGLSGLESTNMLQMISPRQKTEQRSEELR